MSNYTPNETKVFYDQNSPWMNVEIENLIASKNEVFTKHFKNNRHHYYTFKYKVLQEKLENLIESSKQSYYKRVPQKLSSFSTNSTWCCSLLKN